ncbi:hypothetical protein ONZ45_g15263 [Pleurotus djamor]|nr:hypothetical protein ONZ45_g15263 [Pleurotus djamor]
MENKFWSNQVDVPAGITMTERAPVWRHSQITQDIFQETTELQFYANTDTVVFIAQGLRLGGGFEIISGHGEAESVKVSITATYDQDSARVPARVGLITNDIGEGLGIFTSSTDSGKLKGVECLNFQVVVTIPSNEPISWDNLEVDMPNFALSVNFLEPEYIPRVRLTSKNMPIHIYNLISDIAVVKTSNSPISGELTSNKALVLETSDGMISVLLKLVEADDILEGENRVQINATNSPVYAKAILSREGATRASGGRYRIAACTCKSAVNVIIPSYPEDARITLDVLTTDAPAEVEIPNFQGHQFLELILSQSSHITPTSTPSNMTISNNKFWSDEVDSVPNGVRMKASLPQWETFEVTGGEMELKDTTSFELSQITKETTLSFIAKGSYLSGKFHITSSTEVTDVVRVSVSVTYQKISSGSPAKVGRIECIGGGIGLGIFMPSCADPTVVGPRGLCFDVRVTLPAKGRVGDTKLPFLLKKLDVDMTNFSLGATFEEPVFFDQVNLQTVNGPIHASNLVSKVGVINTKNGGITGSFASVESLDLHTTNGRVKVDLSLFKLPAKTGATKVNMRTENGHIDAKVELRQKAKFDLDADVIFHYEVDAFTENGQVKINVPVYPAEARLGLGVWTTNAPVHLNVPNFEGRFRLATTNGKSGVVCSMNSESLPIFDYQHSPSMKTASGEIRCDGRKKLAGTVRAETSNANVQLEV